MMVEEMSATSENNEADKIDTQIDTIAEALNNTTITSENESTLDTTNEPTSQDVPLGQPEEQDSYSLGEQNLQSPQQVTQGNETSSASCVPPVHCNTNIFTEAVPSVGTNIPVADDNDFLLQIIQKAEKENNLFKVRFSTVLCTGLKRTGKTTFCTYLMNKKMEPDKDGDSHTFYVKKQSETSWTQIDLDQLKKLIRQLNTYQSHTSKGAADCGILNAQDLWDILIILDIHAPASTLHLLQPSLITFFTYKIEGRKIFCQDSDKFIKELLSSSCLEKKSTLNFNPLEIQDESKKNLYRYMAFVGTCNGKITEYKHSKEATIFNEKLHIIQQHISTKFPVSFWYENDEEDIEYLYLINKNDCEDRNVCKIKESLKDKIDESSKYKIPFTWILLYFNMRRTYQESENCFVEYSEVHKIWKTQGGSSEKELRLSLKFFHHLGVLFYFNSLHEYVFFECHWLFSKIEYLLNNMKDSRCNVRAKTVLKQEGMLLDTMIEEIKFKAPGGIKLQNFIKLLEDVNFITLVGKNYFIPDILNPSKQINCNPGCANPLLITLSHGVIHRRVFCFLVAHVMNNLPKGWSKLKQSYKDLITFSAGPDKYVHIVDKTVYLEIQINSDSLQSECDSLLASSAFKIIKKALQDVKTKLQIPYAWKCGFLCCHDRCKGEPEHMMMMIDGYSTPVDNACCSNTGDQCRLSTKHTAWFWEHSDMHGQAVSDQVDGEDGDHKSSSTTVYSNANPASTNAEYVIGTDMPIRNSVKPGDCTPTLKKLQNLGVIAEMSSDWYQLGLQFLDVSKLNAIRKNFNNVTECCTSMFEHWLSANPKATWNQLLEALRSKGLDMNQFADTLENQLNGLPRPGYSAHETDPVENIQKHRNPSIPSLGVPEQASQPVVLWMHPNYYLDMLKQLNKNN